MNGYFQLYNEADETSLMIFPPKEGGKPCDINEAVDYLNAKNIEYSLPSVYAYAKKMGNDPLKIPLHKGKGRPEWEMLKVRITSDGMSASCCFYPASNDGESMTKGEIINDLKHRGVRYGIKEEVIDAYIKNRSYCEYIDIAAGTPADNGDGGSIDYFFNTNPKINPTLNEDGSVDFFNLNVIENVRQGQTLARLNPPKPPQTGRTVRDEILKPLPVKQVRFHYGKNVEEAEDGAILIASCDGHVKMDGERIRVEDVLTVKDVDNSTGNLEFQGSIEIAGNICENFTVKAGGNINVGGIIEGATVEAGGDIIIARGMNGMGKGVISAGGNVVSRFFENATVSAGMIVQTDSIINSEVNAGDMIKVGGKRGIITGGRCRAANGIEAKNIGSLTGGSTTLEVGADPALKSRLAEINKIMADDVEVINKTKPIIASIAEKIKKGQKIDKEHLTYAQNLNTLFNMKQKELDTLSEEQEQIQQKMVDGKKASVKAVGDVAQGTVVVIGELSMTTKSSVSHCKFVVDRGDVKMMGL